MQSIKEERTKDFSSRRKVVASFASDFQRIDSTVKIENEPNLSSAERSQFVRIQMISEVSEESIFSIQHFTE